MDKPIINEESRKDLTESFKSLTDPVKLMLFTREGTNDKYNEVATKLIGEVTSLSDLLTAEFHKIDSPEADKHKVTRSPSLLIAPDKFKIRFTGTPLGEEGSTLIMSIVLTSTGKQVLKPEHVKALGALKDKRHVQVYVSPT